MAGRHEPPTNRSFYLSVATSTLRAVIVIALVVGGIVVINSAFPESDAFPNGGVPGGDASTSPSAPQTPTEPGVTGDTGQNGTTDQEPNVVDMAVAVRNGTSTSGLAGDTARKLESDFGVNAIQIDDAPSTVSVTTIYFRKASSQDEAELLAREFFKKIEPKVARLEAGSGVERDAQIAIYLGTDYAATQS